ncbi:PREDICTED: uncharacterized protein LOC104739687 [Camelina sativa]|uniref:Uncharacterized protein LOC104739687 n=1 Tax=Camelina sativa TaxID=90675 RepID=A0ABM0VMH2_CAMSA|nr:PREDICTED: uncharacterized protein LOC104739687 [Camelina sativa]
MRNSPSSENRNLSMVPESTGVSLSGEDFEFDIDFEFDAPRFYDFSRPELYSETEDIETWFLSSGDYPPSPFSPKFNWKFEPLEQVTSIVEESKPVEVTTESLDTTGLNRNEKFNGFIYYNQTVKDVSKKKSCKSKTKSSISTLTRPTASLLARQNKPLDIYSVQLLTRCQRSLAKFGDNVSPNLVSKLQNQDIKRQKPEAKVAHVGRRSKLTVPREPNLRTAERSERHRSKVNSETEKKNAKPSSKTHTRNKSINLEPSLTSLPTTKTPRCLDLQAFRFRTSLRANERSSNAKTDAIQENDATTKSRTLKRTDSSKSRIAKENHSRKINCLLDAKRSSKEELGEATHLEYGNQSSCRTDSNRNLDLCRKFDSQVVARNLITA